MTAASHITDRPSHTPTAATDDDRVLTRAQAAAFNLVSVRALDRWAAQGIGPRRVKIGPRRVGYLLSDLRQFRDASTV